MGGVSETGGLIKTPASTISINLRAIGFGLISTKLDWNDGNREKAVEQRKKIMRKHRLGTLDIAAEFPNNRVARKCRKVEMTFRLMCEKYLGTVKNQEWSTLKGKTCNLLNKWCNAIFPNEHGKMVKGGRTLGEMPLEAIKHSDMALIANELFADKDPKTRNNQLANPSLVFDLAVRDGLVARNPVTGVDRGRKQRKSQHHAFTVSEAESIIASAFSLFGIGWMNYFTIGFFCGLRPSELISLLWKDVDLTKGVIRITHARVDGRDKDSTKTFEPREVKLCPRAKAAFIRQRAITGNSDHGEVFEQAEGERVSSLQPTYPIWEAVIKQAGLEHRNLTPKALRSTSVTWRLTISTSPVEIPVIAKMHGHQPATMIKHYTALVTEEVTEEMRAEIRDAMAREGFKQLAVA